MKKLIFVNGTMGVGKTATCKQLQKILPKCVFLDGDWCWDASPFIVTSETKTMVQDNIGYLLNNFLECSEYENIVFCWVMHEDSIINDIISLIKGSNHRLYKFSLICSEDILKLRISKDVEDGIRENDVLNRSLSRLKNYLSMDTQKIDTSDITPIQTAEAIYNCIYK